MESCRLPIELCEAIMDAIPSSDEYITPDEYDTLVACRETCLSWSVRAKAILDTHWCLKSPQSVGLFVSALRSSAQVASRMESIVHLELDWGQYSGPPYLSQSMDLFMTSLPSSISSLIFFSVVVDLSPRVLRMRLPFFSRLTVVQFFSVTFDTLGIMLDFIWACPNLESLTLELYWYGGTPPTRESVVRFQNAREYRHGCQKLRQLRICHAYGFHHPLTRLPVGGALFGSALTRLDFTIDNFVLDGNITPFIQGAFPQLQHVYIWMIERVVVAYEGPSMLHYLAAGLGSHELLEEIYFDTRCCNGVVWDGQAWCERIVGRADEWGGRNLRSLFAPSLKSLLIVIRDGGREEEEICTQQVLSAFPDASDLFTIESHPVLLSRPDTPTTQV
ncbi:hypothetical protein C8Q79DRAFT_269135 [Trametes meyenii]|nr:hypothetical protein C8Q79DRAFT_269135 [Trametes meyenii]